MALNARLPARARFGPQRPKVSSDENAINKYVRQPSVVGPVRVPIKTGPQRPALSEVTTTAVNRREQKAFGKEKDTVAGKRERSASTAGTGPQRVPLGPAKSTIATSTSAITVQAVPLRPQRPMPVRKAEPVPEPIPRPIQQDENTEDESMDIVEDECVAVHDEVPLTSEVETREEEEEDELDEDDEPDVPVSRIWPELSLEAARRYKTEIDRINATFHDEVDMFDTTMVSEYADEIFEYMGNLEVEMMPKPDYITGQTELSWDYRQSLVDWLLQVHLRYHLLPETLWIAINVVDRFLSKRVVSTAKLQLVGVTAMFIAAKYEEILAPSVDEFVFMTADGFQREEILKGERIVLQTLEFKVSSYCSPYSWMRRISKADDYDIQTRTLCKYLVEVTLLDHKFLRVKPSLIAAVGMYTSCKMLGHAWSDAFIFYSGHTEEHLIPGHNLIIRKLLEPDFEKQYVTRKYATKKFLKASIYALEWAHTNGPMDGDGCDWRSMEDRSDLPMEA